MLQLRDKLRNTWEVYTQHADRYFLDNWKTISCNPGNLIGKGHVSVAIYKGNVIMASYALNNIALFY
jgi:hypothetical protein